MTTESEKYPTTITEDEYKKMRETPDASLREHKNDLQAELFAWDKFQRDEAGAMSPDDEACFCYMGMWLDAYEEELDRREEEKNAQKESKSIQEMTDEELAEAYQSVYDARKEMLRQFRNATMTPEDEVILENMNTFALAVTQEQLRRREK
jgi:hypothetical protein